MSLAMYAAPIDYEFSMNNNDKRKTNNNKTQKRNFINNNEDIDNDKINNVIRKIQNLPEDNNEFSNFNPLPPPTSVGVETTKLNDPNNNNNNNRQIFNNSTHNSTNSSTNISTNSSSNIEQYTGMFPDAQNYNEPTTNNNLLLNNSEYEKYYKRFIPNYDKIYNVSGNNNNNNDILIDKLNYMIHLLEEKQDEKTNNVTEEVILYSFLGVFIIFIVDSFSSMKKYTR